MELGPKQEILLPVRPGFIVLSLLAGFLINLLPSGGIVQWLRPDLLAMILLYWCIHQPQRVGIGAAWLLGILMDVSDAALFGEHALAYSLMAFMAIGLRRRVSMLEIDHQFTHVTLLLFVMQTAIMLIGLISKHIFAGWGYFLGSVTAGLLWPFLTHLLKLPQRPGTHPDRL